MKLVFLAVVLVIVLACLHETEAQRLCDFVGGACVENPEVHGRIFWTCSRRRGQCVKMGRTCRCDFSSGNTIAHTGSNDLEG